MLYIRISNIFTVMFRMVHSQHASILGSILTT